METPVVGPIYPEIEVELVGQDGNAFNLLGICKKAMRQAKMPEPVIDSFFEEAMSEDYDHLLMTCQRWFTVS